MDRLFVADATLRALMQADTDSHDSLPLHPVDDLTFVDFLNHVDETSVAASSRRNSGLSADDVAERLLSSALQSGSESVLKSHLPELRAGAWTAVANRVRKDAQILRVRGISPS